MNREELEAIDDEAMAAWNAHDPDRWVQMFADQFVWHDSSMPEPITDLEGAKAYFNGWIQAFPDMSAKETIRVVGDDTVAVEIQFTGTNTGPLAMAGSEVPATGRSVVGTGAYFARVRDGKVVEFNTHPDVANLMGQLGLMPGA